MQALKEISEKQEDYLPVVQGRVVATGSKEDIFIIRELLSRHGVEIKPFPEVLNTYWYTSMNTDADAL
jgi:hypothetical protein